MIELEWTRKALSDLVRLHEFLAAVDRTAAARTVQSLAAAPDRLLQYPRLGEQLEEFAPREIRRIPVGAYEIRYEIRDSIVFVLRVRHTREDR